MQHGWFVSRLCSNQGSTTQSWQVSISMLLSAGEETWQKGTSGGWTKTGQEGWFSSWEETGLTDGCSGGEAHME